MNRAQDNRLRGCGGFTLIEILLVMLITSILVLGVRAAYWQAHLVWSNVERERPAYHTARLLTETLRQELTCLYFPRTSEKEEDGPFELLYLPNQKTELTFYSLTPSWNQSPESSRVARIRYRFRKDPDAGETLLERFEQPCAGDKRVGKESSDVIVKGLSDFRVWAIDPNSAAYDAQWRQSYDSRDVPPRALKVQFKWPADKDAPAVDFESCILIPCQACLTP
jgi:prepilin-type N-terminal cleavage/methylation domain-containing protein